MSYAASNRERHPHRSLGTIYDFPETSDSSVIPNTTFHVDVPLPQLTHDAIATAWPEIESRAPGLVGAAWPGVQQMLPTMMQAVLPYAPAFVDAALPQIIARAPEIATALQPEISALVDQMAPQIYAALKPQIEADAAAALNAGKPAAYVLGGAALLVTVFVAKKAGWLR